MKNVGYLDFSGNPIKEIPDWVFKQDNILSINLQETYVTEAFLTSSLGLKNFKGNPEVPLRIDLLGTSVRKIPKYLRNKAGLEFNLGD